MLFRVIGIKKSYLGDISEFYIRSLGISVGSSFRNATFSPVYIDIKKLICDFAS